MKKDELIVKFFESVVTKVLYSKGADHFFELLSAFVGEELKRDSIIVSVPTTKIATFHARYIVGQKDLLKEVECKFADYSFVQQIKALRSDYVDENAKKRIFFWLTYYREQDYFLAIDVEDDIREELTFLEEYFSIFFSNLISWDRQVQISSLVHIDDVSGLFNQRKLHIDLDYLIAESTARKESFAVLFLDIDHFKLVNDKYGHLVGTALLKQVSLRLKKVVRDGDLLYRYGGDEFVVFLPLIEESMALKVATRILESVRSAPYKIEDLNLINLSVSVGVAIYPSDAQSKTEILELADKVMYRAKDQGRGQVCMAKDFFDSEKGEKKKED